MAKITDFEAKELGFGKYITTTGRIMEPNGSFNIERLGSGWHSNIYFNLITMPWRYFLLYTLAVYLLINFCFSLIYVVMSPDQLTGMVGQDGLSHWAESFFFSTQTLTTVGYGRVSPIGLAANVVASFESFVGLLGFALISGLLYGRFSRPKASIAFSDQILVSPFKNGQALMFRIANQRKNELQQAEVQMLLAINETDADGNISRIFRELPLQLNQVIFFTMSWTLVHPINEQSYIWGIDKEDLQALNPEIFVLVKATEEANQQFVSARRSYIFSDIVWGAKFKPMMSKDKTGRSVVLLDQISSIEV
jgi:inward rectifier potassium channel